MTPQQALIVIEQALNMANVKGAFTLADSQAVINALAVLKGAQASDDNP